jgi:hypothetical protein
LGDQLVLVANDVRAALAVGRARGDLRQEQTTANRALGGRTGIAEDDPTSSEQDAATEASVLGRVTFGRRPARARLAAGLVTAVATGDLLVARVVVVVGSGLAVVADAGRPRGVLEALVLTAVHAIGTSGAKGDDEGDGRSLAGERSESELVAKVSARRAHQGTSVTLTT